jgi:hypothetical protein
VIRCTHKAEEGEVLYQPLKTQDDKDLDDKDDKEEQFDKELNVNSEGEEVETLLLQELVK